jgi:hypothetical protein
LINVDQEGKNKLEITKGEPHDIERTGTRIVPHSSSEIKIFNTLYVLFSQKV